LEKSVQAAFKVEVVGRKMSAAVPSISGTQSVNGSEIQ